MVDVFRRSEAAGAHVDEAIAARRARRVAPARRDRRARRQRARHAGLLAAMDRCPAIELPRLATG